MQKYSFRKVFEPLLGSKIKAGVRPSKPYEFEGSLDYPYSAVGIIQIFIKGEFVAHVTGSLIAPKLVLTVANNCDLMHLSSATDLYFIPAPIYQRNEKSFKVIKVHSTQE